MARGACGAKVSLPRAIGFFILVCYARLAIPIALLLQQERIQVHSARGLDEVAPFFESHVSNVGKRTNFRLR